ncbi:hypothetical protein M8C21_013041, partial [Ambrosia artemisiifolia]
MTKVYPKSVIPPLVSSSDQQHVFSESSNVILTVWKKSLLFNCDGFTVFDAKGNLVFRVDNYATGNKSEVVLMDATGRSLLTIRRKKASITESWLVYDGETKVNPRYSVTKHVNFLKGKSLAHMSTVGSSNNRNKKSNVAYEIEGSYTQRSCVVYDDKRRRVAEIKRKEAVGGVAFGGDVFRLVVEPEIGSTVAMALVVVLDQMFGGSSKRMLRFVLEKDVVEDGTTYVTLICWRVYPNCDQQRLVSESSTTGRNTDPVVLTVWKKSLLFNCDGFTVFDSKGNLVFRVDNYAAGNRSEVVLMDATGRSLHTIRRKRASITESWLVYDGETKVSPRYSVTKHVNFLNGKSLAHVSTVGSPNNKNKKSSVAYDIEGSYTQRSCVVYDDKRRCVAEIKRKEAVGGVAFGGDVFRLVVQPDIGSTVAMALVVVLDQMSDMKSINESTFVNLGSDWVYRESERLHLDQHIGVSLGDVY